MIGMTDIDEDSVLAALREHIGHRRGITADTLVFRITGDQYPNAAAERKLRRIVTALRLRGYHVCAHPSTGYYMAENEAELNATCEYLYDRAMASLTQISRMKRTSVPDLRGQLRLKEKS